MSLKGFIIRRVLYIVPVMLGITLMNFTLINLTPGDPIIVRIGLIHCETEECVNTAYNREAKEYPTEELFTNMHSEMDYCQ